MLEQVVTRGNFRPNSQRVSPHCRGDIVSLECFRNRREVSVDSITYWKMGRVLGDEVTEVGRGWIPWDV